MIRKIAALGLGAVGAAALAGPVSAAETILYNSFVPPKHIINTGIVHPWHDEIGRVTEGRVKVKRPAKNMAAPPRQFDLVTQGIADGAYIFNAFLQKRVPLVQLSLLPLIYTSAEAHAVALWRTYKKFFEAKNQYKGVVLLGFFAGTGGHMASLKDPILSVEGLRRMKMWSLPAFPAKALKVLGVTVVPGPAVRIYPIVSRGTVDGFSGLPIGEAHRFKVSQFARSYTKIPGSVFAPTFSAFVSPQKWQKIAKRDRELIMSVSGEALARLSSSWDRGDVGADEQFEKMGGEIHVASGSFLAALRKAWTPFHDEWVAEADELGVDGKAALAYFLSEAKTVAAENK